MQEKSPTEPNRVDRSPERFLELRSAGSTILSSAVIVLSTIFVYSNTLDASFQFDDLQNIVLNETVRDLRALWPPSGSRFLGYLSFALNYSVGGLSVFGYHVTNLAIHCGNALLVFWLVRITFQTPALRRADAAPLVRGCLPLAAALLFALHPVQTQAVTYVVQRFASLATLFYLLALALYAKAMLSLDADRPSRVRAASLYCLSALVGAAAMKTKEISFTLPLVVATYEWLFFRTRRRLLLVAPFAAIALLLVPFDVLVHGQELADLRADWSQIAAQTPDIPRLVYLLTQTRVALTYLRLLVWPVRQNLDYDFPFSYSLAEPEVLAALAVLLAVAGIAVLFLRHARRTNTAAGALVFFGVVWFFATLSVESSLIPIRDVINEHRLYLPSVGAAVAVGTGLLYAVTRARLHVSLAVQAAAVLLLTAGPLAAAAHARNRVWKDDLTLWTDVVAKSPNKPRAHEALGLAYLARGAMAEAVDQFELSLRATTEQDVAPPDREAIRRELAERIGPARAREVERIGELYEERGQLDAARREYRDAIRLDPSSAAAHMKLGTAYHLSARVEDAMAEYREAIRIDPAKAGAHVNLGAAYYAKGQIDDAIREYRDALRLDPSIGEAHANLAAAYEAKGLLGDAAREHREAARLEASAPRANRRLAPP